MNSEARQRYVAFLRGINLGKRRMPMSRLMALFQELGFDCVETFIASGNVLFSARAAEISQLEARIARHLEGSLGYPVDTFVRTTDEVARVGRPKYFAKTASRASRFMLDFFSRSSRRKWRAGSPPCARTPTSFASWAGSITGCAEAGFPTRKSGRGRRSKRCASPVRRCGTSRACGS